MNPMNYSFTSESHKVLSQWWAEFFCLEPSAHVKSIICYAAFLLTMTPSWMMLTVSLWIVLVNCCNGELTFHVQLNPKAACALALTHPAATVSLDGSQSCPESASGSWVDQLWQADNIREAFSLTVVYLTKSGNQGKLHQSMTFVDD